VGLDRYGDIRIFEGISGRIFGPDSGKIRPNPVLRRALIDSIKRKVI